MRHAVLVAFVLLLAATGCGGSDNDDSASSTTTEQTSSVERCVESWNAAANKEAQEDFDAFGPGIDPPENVFVGFSATDPDTCVVSASNPDDGLSAQWLESSTGAYTLVGGEPTHEPLPESLTHWNATAEMYTGIIQLK